MYTAIIFIPSVMFNQVEDKEAFILGVVSEDTSLSTIYFTLHEKCFNIKERVPNSHITIIGYCGKKVRYKNLDTWPILISDCIVLNNSFSEPELIKVFLKGVSFPIENCRVLIYDKTLFSKSELLLSPLEYFKNGETSTDYFKTVTTSIKDRKLPNQNLNNDRTYSKLRPLIPYCFLVLNLIICCSTKFNILQKVSTLAVHFHCCFLNMKWALEDFSFKKRITLKLGNYVFGIMADWLCGILVLYFLVNYIAIDKLYDKLAIHSEVRLI